MPDTPVHTPAPRMPHAPRQVGVMYGNPETTSGGQALKFYSSIRLDIRWARARARRRRESLNMLQ